MPVRVELPRELTRFTADTTFVDLSASTVGDALNQLFARFPDLQTRVVDRNGHLLPYLPLFLNREKLPPGDYRNRPVQDGDQLEIVAIASGG